ncbi:EI24 domain-containing protein [Anianabacter salinae]|uniref:EI24 domain-containing protein n=1 Tax=Anianabacter salinae TaxID=2851023 RepID=UPI00225E519E|nr:EI24 domain-containing protein [Anianabacter salinae]MBV0912639.1 EI24 domain-containing protein [Anianabacter salinae]
MILSDFLKALAQLGDPRFRGVLAKGLGLTLALLVAVYALTFWGVGLLLPDSFSLPWIGEITWVDDIASGASVILMMGLSVFLMVPVASAFTGIFLDDVADAVEQSHYPGLPPPIRFGLAENLSQSLAFLGTVIAANVVALVLYLFLAPFAPLIFWSLNGFLLGREYFQLVALRRMPPPEAKRLRARHGLQIWLAGALMAVPLTIPVVNLLVPVLGAATFTHLFHRLRSRPSG